MKRTLVRFASLLAVCLATTLPALESAAQATRTWVSGVGDDVNPCSRTAPCKTFAGAISKTAAGGEISVLDPGGFGAVTITKSITINGAGTLSSILASGTNGVIVNATIETDAVVILRNLHINGGGTGIDGVKFMAGGSLHIEDCVIYGFSGQGVNFMPAGNSSLYITHTNVRDNTGGGVTVVPGASGHARAVLDDVRIQGNGRGMRAEDASTVTVKNSIVAGNTNNGFTAMSNTRSVVLNIDSSTSAQNGGSGVYSGGALSQIRLFNSAVLNNSGLGLSVSGGAMTSLGGNRVQGNTVGEGSPTATIPSL